MRPGIERLTIQFTNSICNYSREQYIDDEGTYVPTLLQWLSVNTNGLRPSKFGTLACTLYKYATNKKNLSVWQEIRGKDGLSDALRYRSLQIHKCGEYTNKTTRVMQTCNEFQTMSELHLVE